MSTAAASALRPLVYRLPHCEVHTSLRAVLAGGITWHLETKAFDALVHLIEHRGRIVGKDELLRSVWGRIELSDSVIARSIMKARAAIGDRRESPLIQTVHRAGYRFVGEVDVLHAGETAPADWSRECFAREAWARADQHLEQRRRDAPVSRGSPPAPRHRARRRRPALRQRKRSGSMPCRCSLS